VSNNSEISLIVFAAVFLLASTALAEFSDFAIEVVDYSGSFGPSPYNDPCAVLGKPSTVCKNSGGMGSPSDPNFRVKLVEAAYNVDLNDKKVITTINPGEYITVKFDHKVADYPGDLYGRDFIVFGNPYFFGSGFVSDGTNMNAYQLTVGGQFEEIEVSVSQDGLTWYSFNGGPYADDLFPTQAYKWDRQSGRWTDEEMDFTRPVDPNLDYGDFENISAADAIELYNGSGGGTSFDLRDLADFASLEIDPNTGYRWIQYVKLKGAPESQGEIDAISDVAACGDPTHPYPVGDTSHDCRVNFEDLSVLSRYWLTVVEGPDDPAAIADIYEDGIVNFKDWALMAGNWLECTWKCP
jgi:hypothetical protein